VREKTSTGGIIAIVCLIVIGFLSFERFRTWTWLEPNRLSRMDSNFDGIDFIKEVDE
jgi:hypothetical protein